MFRKKSFLAFIVLVSTFLVGFFFLTKPNPNIKNPFTKPKTLYDFEQIFVPVAYFTYSKNGISLEELKSEFKDPQIFDPVLPKDYQDQIKGVLKIDKFSEKVEVIEKDKIIEYIRNHKNSLSILPIDLVDFRVKSLALGPSADGFIWDKNFNKDAYPLIFKDKTEDQNLSQDKFDSSKITTLTSVGDVILGRTVAKKMAEYGYEHPFLKVADELKKADITFADLETPLSDQISPPYEGMSFIAPQKAIEGLLLSGIDVVSLANNHSTNFGENVFIDTLNLLEGEGIEYCGGGRNLTESHRPAILETNGLKFAFLSYNSIIGAVNATEDSAGVAKFDIKPWAEVDNLDDIETIKSEVAAAKKEADIVVLQLHWGVEYTAEPIESQINVAHAALNSGADLIIGTHPHWVQGVEFYKAQSSGLPSTTLRVGGAQSNKFIAYSLGNFVFDQEWSIETKQGLILETIFYEKKLVSIQLVPIQIEDYNQPYILDSESDFGQMILKRIFDASTL